MTSLVVDRAPGRPEVLWMDNGTLRLGLVPAAGGRLLSVRLAGRETLWRNSELLDDDLHPRPGHRVEPHDGPMTTWANYGGDKTWPAPQGWSGPAEWAGPPDPVLDSGPYAWTTAESAGGALSVTMTSGADPRTGLRLERTLTLAPAESAYEMVLTATNVSARPVRWALWNVTQRAADRPGSGGVRVGVDRPQVVDLAVGTAAPSHSAADPGVIDVPHQDVVGKLGFPGATGWLAHAALGSTATQVVPVDEAGEYPDGGSRVEVWMEHPLEEPLPHLDGLWPTSRIVEVEVLGPLVTLRPGQRTRLPVRCGLATGHEPVVTVSWAGHWAMDTFHPYVDGTLHLEDDDAPLAQVRAGRPAMPTLPPDAAGRRAVLRRDGTGQTVDAGTVPRRTHS